MQLIINKNNYDRSFIYDYLKDYIYDTFKLTADTRKFDQLDSYFNINSYDIILFALENLSITENAREYSIKINKNIRYKSANISGLINVITFGNRDVKGYTILYDIFDLISKNIDKVYNIWLDSIENRMEVI